MEHLEEDRAFSSADYRGTFLLYSVYIEQYTSYSIILFLVPIRFVEILCRTVTFIGSYYIKLSIFLYLINDIKNVKKLELSALVSLLLFTQI